MSTLARPAVLNTPDWVVAQMPPGYKTRMDEIQRLSTDLQEMDRIGHLLWEVGEPLRAAVRAVFAHFDLEMESPASGDTAQLKVKLDSTRSLLLYISALDEAIQKKSPELTAVFQMLQHAAADSDRVILVGNHDCATPPGERDAPITPEALAFLKRMGANFLTTPSLFKLWTLSIQEGRDRARTYIDRLHGQDGGLFSVPTP